MNKPGVTITAVCSDLRGDAATKSDGKREARLNYSLCLLMGVIGIITSDTV